jgi:hypothetical protein
MTPRHRALQSSRWSLLRRLYSSRSLFVLIVLTLAGVFLIIASSLLHSRPSTQSVLEAVGTGLLASSLVSGIFLFFTNQELVELLLERIGTLQASSTRQIVHYLAQTNPTYLPIAVYEPTDSLRTSFNRDLMASLHTSQTYRFPGMTGYFVPIRVAASETTLSLLRVRLTDTSDHAALRLRVTREMALGPSKDYATLVNNIKEQVRQCVVGLLEIRGRCQTN